jgi:hypothetical protein
MAEEGRHLASPGEVATKPRPRQEGQLRPKRCGANAWYAAAGFSCNKLAGAAALAFLASMCGFVVAVGLTLYNNQ